MTSKSRPRLRTLKRRTRRAAKEVRRKKSPAQVAKQAFRRNNEAGLPEDPLAALQQRLFRWEVRNFGQGSLEHAALGVAEESGELCHAVLKHAQKIRGMGDIEVLREKAGDAVADIAIYAINLCSKLGLDFATLLRETSREVMKRQWKTNPVDGKSS